MYVQVKGRLKRTEFEILGPNSLCATTDYDGVELDGHVRTGLGTSSKLSVRVELSTHEVIKAMRACLPCDPSARARFILDHLI